jgi:hypothetical protein
VKARSPDERSDIRDPHVAALMRATTLCEKQKAPAFAAGAFHASNHH